MFETHKSHVRIEPHSQVINPNAPKSREKTRVQPHPFVTSVAPFLTLYLDKKEAEHFQHPSTDSEDRGVTLDLNWKEVGARMIRKEGSGIPSL